MPKPVPADAGHPALNPLAKVVHFLLYAALVGMLLIGLGMFNEANMLDV